MLAGLSVLRVNARLTESWSHASRRAVPRASHEHLDAIASMVTPLFDGNRDGSIADDVTSMIGGFMKRS